MLKNRPARKESNWVPDGAAPPATKTGYQRTWEKDRSLRWFHGSSQGEGERGERRNHVSALGSRTSGKTMKSQRHAGLPEPPQPMRSWHAEFKGSREALCGSVRGQRPSELMLHPILTGPREMQKEGGVGQPVAPNAPARASSALTPADCKQATSLHPCVQGTASGCQVQAGTPERGPRWTQQAKQPCQPCSKQTRWMEFALQTVLTSSLFLYLG